MLLLLSIFIVSSSVAASSTKAVAVEAFVVEALAVNPELMFYEAEIAAAKGSRTAAGKWTNPEAEVSLGYKRSEDRDTGDLLGEGAAWGVSVSQTFDFPGRMTLRKAIANRQMAIAELGLAQFRAGLAAKVRHQAFRVLVAQENLQAATEVRNRVEELLDVLVQRDPAGVTPLLETRVIEANAITLQRRVTEAERALQTAALDLNLLTGRPMEMPIRIATTDLRFPDKPSVGRLLDVTRTNNYELRLRQAELEQQGFKVRLRQKERWPSVTLTPFYSNAKAADNETIFGIGVSLPLPLWDRKQGETEQSRARLQQAETLMRVTQRNVERQLTEHALAYAKQLDEMARWRTDAVRQFREAAELGDRHYRLGSLPVSTYLELQKQYLEATDALLQTQADAVDSWQQLELLTGEPLPVIQPSAAQEAKP